MPVIDKFCKLVGSQNEVYSILSCLSLNEVLLLQALFIRLICPIRSECCWGYILLGVDVMTFVAQYSVQHKEGNPLQAIFIKSMLQRSLSKHHTRSPTISQHAFKIVTGPDSVTAFLAIGQFVTICIPNDFDIWLLSPPALCYFCNSCLSYQIHESITTWPILTINVRLIPI